MTLCPQHGATFVLEFRVAAGRNHWYSNTLNMIQRVPTNLLRWLQRLSALPTPCMWPVLMTVFWSLFLWLTFSALSIPWRTNYMNMFSQPKSSNTKACTWFWIVNISSNVSLSIGIDIKLKQQRIASYSFECDARRIFLYFIQIIFIHVHFQPDFSSWKKKYQATGHVFDDVATEVRPEQTKMLK